MSLGFKVTTHEIRRRFLDYFVANGHAEVASSPVVPHDDPTLLFTNAGMNQFKDVFLGKSRRDYTRAATSQKCVRVGGKHNDLDNVGHTRRHLTFFEMIGNFSFGDYFKEKAIDFAWQVSTEVFQFAPEKIYPTVFRDDDEAFELWTRYVPAERITRFGEKENFWAMGDTGPCGPCSELLYDRGQAYGDAPNPLSDPTGERYLEFWNLVFMQFNRDIAGEKNLLPRPSIDTGSGLERVMSLIQNTETVFETDILRGIIHGIERASGKTYVPGSALAPAFRVIADHLRCLSFAIADGAQPSNTDRGYVLRKVLRRAVRYGKQLGFDRPFLARLLPDLINLMGDQYRELREAESRIDEVVTVEEENFFKTLKRGGTLLNDIVERAQKGSQRIIPGDDAFRLKDTYGLPFEEIQLIAHDANLSVDEKRYQELEEEARNRSKAAHKTTKQIASSSVYEAIVERAGANYFMRAPLPLIEAKVVAIIENGQEVTELSQGTTGEIILDQTLFYAEMGGQVGDTGILKNKGFHATVSNTTSPFKGIVSHHVKVESGKITCGDLVEVSIDRVRRHEIENNHTATHLLNWALTEVLGAHVRQSGSLVNGEYLRFDFSHHKAVTSEELHAVERLVNHHIRMNYVVQEYELPYEEVQKRSDIKQFFGDKYGAIVRVVEIGPSKELCGGTHATQTGRIGYFRLLKESSIASGVRRIEALTGEQAVRAIQDSDLFMTELAGKLKVAAPKVSERIDALLGEVDSLGKEVKELKRQKMLSSLSSLQAHDSKKHSGVKVYFGSLECASGDLKDAAQEITKRQNGASHVVVIGCSDGGKAHLFIKVSDGLLKEVNAADLLKKSLPLVEGNGGGKAESAQGAGKNPQKLHAAIEFAVGLVDA